MYNLFIFFLLIIQNGYSLTPISITPIDIIKDAFADTVWTWECTMEHGCRKMKLNEIKTCDNVDEKKNDCKEEIINREKLSEEVCNLLCPPGNLWPQPTGELNISRTYVPVNTNNIILTIKPCDLKAESTNNESYNLTQATDFYIQRFQKFGQIKKSKSFGYGILITLLIHQPDVYKFENGVDESYALNIDLIPDDVMINLTITAQNYLGIRHALETFSQLLVYDSMTGNIVTASDVKITDKPKYSHRGISIDTARNYISITGLLRILDAMASVKLNTLHWHITDSHSFPFVSKSLPEFSKYGAYSPDKIYTEEDIHQLIEYGRLNGIRIVPELDLPAHVGEGWQAAPGAVVCFNAQPWTVYCVEPPCGQVDPTSDIVFDTLRKLYKDFNDAFDSDLFHMGGDEVNLHCWNTTQSIVEYMKKMNIERTNEGFHKLWSNFQEKAKEILKETSSKDKQYILWTSSLTDGHLEEYLNNTEYIIQVWTRSDDHSIKNLLKKGFRIILSNYDTLYFDCGFGAWVGTGNNWCSPYIPWQKIYENTPEKILNKLGLDNTYEQLILGSEAALWTEQADDSSLDNRLWPRGAALAESLWSPGLSWHSAEKRYLLQRERFVQLGISADTVQPEWCRQNQGYCYL